MNLFSIDTTSEHFWSDLDNRLAFESEFDDNVFSTVQGILRDVKKRGDAALMQYTEKFDALSVKSANELVISKPRLKQAYDGLQPHEQQALELAANRVKQYAQHQKMESWQYTEADGTLLGQQVMPLDSVGLYVPGGKAAYPSSVLMNAIPAKVAGVASLIMVVPAPAGILNEFVLAAAHICDVDKVITVGGAQAIAALAYGTESVPAVDKIVGPGNIFVATAKRLVFGTVGIDMIAGPSEILIICDGKTDPDWIAMDLFSQAEHDEDAQSILICPEQSYLDDVTASINKLIEAMPRKTIIKQSLQERGCLIKVIDMDEAIKVANYIAPEHLELSIDNPEDIAGQIKHAGAIFMGRYTAEALGDYCAGPNHVLPTSRTARFSSPLGVYDFQKRSSLINCSQEGASQLGKTASILARGEGLVAHACSAEYRIKKD
jgi:histidinol dehydrogenase